MLSPDLILHGGKIITLDRIFGVPLLLPFRNAASLG
jgi:hypothetical protein